jgi:hypothetical protein
VISYTSEPLYPVHRMLSVLEAVLHELQKTNMAAPTGIRTLILQFPLLKQPQ